MSDKFGVNIWWTVKSMVMDGKKAQEILKKYGFEPEDMPLPSRRAEVGRAVYSFQNRLGKSNRRVTEKVSDNGMYVAYGILDREDTGKDEVAFEQGTTVKLNKETDAVSVEGKLAGEVMAAVEAFTGKVTDEDVRAFLSKVVHVCKGVSKRPSGGIYFIPANAVGMIEDARKVLEDMGAGSRIYVERIQDGKEERENVWSAVVDGVEQELKETLNAVERIEKRVSSIQGHQAKLEELNELVDVYRGLLGEEAKYQDVAERIEAAVKVVAEKMRKVQMGTAASVAKAAAPVAAAKSEPEVPAKAKGGSVVEAAVVVLKESGKPMTAMELFGEAKRKGLYESDAKDPFTSFFSVLSKAVAKGEKRVSKVAQGVWKYAA